MSFHLFTCMPAMATMPKGVGLTFQEGHIGATLTNQGFYYTRMTFSFSAMSSTVPQLTEHLE